MIETDPYLLEITECALPVFARMRAECPISRVERFDTWPLTRFEGVWSVCEGGHAFRAPTTSRVLTS